MNTIPFESLPSHLSSDEKDEYKFLITSKGDVFISDKPYDPFDTLIHADWLKDLQRRGEIDPSETEESVTGGYVKNDNGTLMYWGESTTPISGATEESLFEQLHKNGAHLTSATRE